MNPKTRNVQVEINIDFDLENFPSFRECEIKIAEAIERAKKDLLKKIFEMSEAQALNRKCYILKDRREKRYYTKWGEFSYSEFFRKLL